MKAILIMFPEGIEEENLFKVEDGLLSRQGRGILPGFRESFTTRIVDAELIQTVSCSSSERKIFIETSIEWVMDSEGVAPSKDD